LEITLPSCSFQIFDASEVIHNIFRFAEVNLETETSETRSEEWIEMRNGVRRQINDEIAVIMIVISKTRGRGLH